MCATLDEIAQDVSEADIPRVELIVTIYRAFAHACRWSEAVRTARPNASDSLQAARANAHAAHEIAAKVGECDLKVRTLAALTAVEQLADVSALPVLAGRLAEIPVPPFLVQGKGPAIVPGSEIPVPDKPARRRDQPAVVRVMLTVDKRPWATPQRLRPNVFYDCSAVVTIPSWPDGTDQLVLDFVSTLPASVFAFEPLRVDKEERGAGEFRCSGHLQFNGTQSIFFEPVSIQLRARFVSTTDAVRSKLATIIGYHRLRARVRDPAADPLSMYPSLDPVLADIVEEVRTLPGVTEEHFTDFVRALGSVGDFMGNAANEAAYKTGQKISEAEFQKQLLHDMRLQLGPEVQEHPHQAGGSTDIQYRTVTIELKVEDKISDRKKIFERYEKQAVQYGSGLGSQLGILCILDLTEKEVPPAPPQNGIKLLSPPVHGYPQDDAPYPARLAALVIDGNLRTPSSYR